MKEKIGLSSQRPETAPEDELPEVTATPDYFALTRPPPPPPPPPVQHNPIPNLPWTPGINPHMRPQTELNPDPTASLDAETLRNYYDILAASKIKLTSPTGASRIFIGTEWNRLEPGPAEVFQFFKRVAESTLNFDSSRQVVRTEDNIIISTSAALFKALGTLMRERRLESHWQIVNTDMVRPVYTTQPTALGRPPGNLQHQHQHQHQHQYAPAPVPAPNVRQNLHNNAPQPRQTMNYPRNPMFPTLRGPPEQPAPMLARATKLPAGYELFEPVADAYGSGLSRSGIAPQLGQAGTDRLIRPQDRVTGPTVPVQGPTTPREQQQQQQTSQEQQGQQQQQQGAPNGTRAPTPGGIGASMSPNLRNLMH